MLSSKGNTPKKESDMNKCVFVLLERVPVERWSLMHNFLFLGLLYATDIKKTETHTTDHRIVQL